MKKGISLIVLVITIIVMIILAAAIIISLSNSNVINKATRAVDETNYKNVTTVAGLIYADYLLNPNAAVGEIGEWIKDKLIQDKVITQEQSSLYRFKNDGSVIKLGTQEEYNYATIQQAYYTVSELGEFTLTLAGKSAAKDGTLTELVVPYGVKIIVSSAANNCTSLTKLILPDTVTIINTSAFSGCTSLDNVIMSKNIRTIGNNAFYNTPWYNNQQTVATNNMVIIEGCLVDGKNTTGKVAIPNTVESIGTSAFYNNKSITSIVIPNTVGEIGASAFSGCTALATVEGANNVTYIGTSAFTNTAWYNGLQDGEIYIGKSLYIYKGTMPSLTIITLKDGTTSIGASAFSGKTTLVSLNMPNTVFSIGESAFYGCTGLTNINTSTNLKSIGASAFYNCNKLAIDMQIPEGVKEIMATTFYGCSALKSIALPSNLENIGNTAFYGCTKITSIQLKDKVKKIANYAFNGCTSLVDITSSKLEHAGGKAFENTPWLTAQRTSATGGIVILGKVVVDGKNATGAITIPSGIISISPIAFKNNVNITSVSLPEGLDTFDSFSEWAGDPDGAFIGCNKITSIVIPSTVTLIGGGTFENCTALTSIQFLGSIPQCDRSSFYRTGITGTMKTAIIEKGQYAFEPAMMW